MKTPDPKPGPEPRGGISPSGIELVLVLIFAAFMLALVIGVAFWSIGFWQGRDSGKWDVYREAHEADRGDFRVDPDSRKIDFVWKTQEAQP